MTPIAGFKMAAGLSNEADIVERKKNNNCVVKDNV